MPNSYLSAHTSNTSAILQFRWRQNTSSNLHHRITNGQPEFLNVQIVIEIGTSNQIINLPFSVRRRSRCRLNHSRSLHIGQFLDTSLSSYNITHFERQIGMFMFLADLQTRLFQFIICKLFNNTDSQ